MIIFVCFVFTASRIEMFIFAFFINMKRINVTRISFSLSSEIWPYINKSTESSYFSLLCFCFRLHTLFYALLLCYLSNFRANTSKVMATLQLDLFLEPCITNTTLNLRVESMQINCQHFHVIQSVVGFLSQKICNFELLMEFSTSVVCSTWSLDGIF